MTRRWIVLAAAALIGMGGCGGKETKPPLPQQEIDNLDLELESGEKADPSDIAPPGAGEEAPAPGANTGDAGNSPPAKAP